MKVAVALALVVFAGGPACTVGRGCTDVGGFEGLGAELPRALFVPTGEAAFEVCDADGCASASQRLGPVPEGPVGRGVSVTFAELGREFEPGRASVTVELFGPGGRLVAATSQEVDLERTYPHGKECDGDGYVGGTVEMTTSDLMRPSRRS